MALYSVLRRSAARMTPTARRLVASQRTYHSRTPSLYSAVQSQLSDNLVLSTSLSCLRRYASAASCSSIKITSGSDWKQLELLEPIIDSIIDSVQDGQDNSEDIETPPERFPFQIKDIPEIKSITLSRKYQGENIHVKVGLHKYDEEDIDLSKMSLLVRVAKSENYTLLFDCNAFPEKIYINSLSIEKHDRSQKDYKGPEYLDRDLKKALDTYLEVRGIEPSIGYFLYNYMVRKYSRENFKWLQKLKMFVQP